MSREQALGVRLAARPSDLHFFASDIRVLRNRIESRHQIQGRTSLTAYQQQLLAEAAERELLILSAVDPANERVTRRRSRARDAE